MGSSFQESFSSANFFQKKMHATWQCFCLPGKYLQAYLLFLFICLVKKEGALTYRRAHADGLNFDICLKRCRFSSSL